MRNENPETWVPSTSKSQALWKKLITNRETAKERKVHAPLRGDWAQPCVVLRNPRLFTGLPLNLSILADVRCCEVLTSACGFRVRADLVRATRQHCDWG